MSTARERVGAEAEERNDWDTCTCDGCKMGEFIAGRTVSAEQIEQAAEEMHFSRVIAMETDAQWIELTDQAQERYRVLTRVAFAAAGFIVEEETS